MTPVVDRRRPQELERPREPEQRQHADLAQLDALLAEVDGEDLVEDAERKTLGEVEDPDPEELAAQQRRGCVQGTAILSVRPMARAEGIGWNRREAMRVMLSIGSCGDRGVGASKIRPDPEAVDRELAAQVGQHAHRRAAGEHDAVLDDAAALAQERVEVGDRAQVDVRRVVPLVGQRVGHRHAAAQDLQRCVQWPKFGNVTIASRPTRSISATIVLGVAHRLQRLRQDHAVERRVVEARRARSRGRSAAR